MACGLQGLWAGKRQHVGSVCSLQEVWDEVGHGQEPGGSFGWLGFAVTQCPWCFWGLAAPFPYSVVFLLQAIL